MQPMGRKPSRFPTKIDNHFHDGNQNWWEIEMCDSSNKTAEKQKVKKEIREQVSKHVK